MKQKQKFYLLKDHAFIIFSITQQIMRDFFMGKVGKRTKEQFLSSKQSVQLKDTLSVIGVTNVLLVYWVRYL